MKLQKIKIILFASVLLIFAFIGLLFFLRPEVSETEKRELTKFPSPTFESVMSGGFTSGVGKWYSDTFPFRDALIDADNAVKGLRGIRTVVVSGGGQGDDIPDDTMPQSEDTGRVDVDDPPIDDPQGEKINGFYQSGDTAYELYNFNRDNSQKYAELINRAAQTLGDGVRVYDLIVPLSYSLYMSDAKQKEIGTSSCTDAIRYMYSGMDQRVKTVDAYPELYKNRSGYLYYRTDHHWTADGAFCAYVAFCNSAGITPTPLASYEKYEFGGFLGTLYSDTNMPAAMKNNPDTVVAYKPNGTNAIYVTDKEGERLKYSNGVVNTNTDTFYQAAASKYNCFIVGDNPLSEIHNESITDGSSICVVKESFGNAFVPFLVDSYEYVYVIDYRYYKAGTLAGFVSEKNIGTVLFINNVIATSTSARLKELSGLIQ